jgi:hypothetical protein
MATGASLSLLQAGQAYGSSPKTIIFKWYFGPKKNCLKMWGWALILTIVERAA